MRRDGPFRAVARPRRKGRCINCFQASLTPEVAPGFRNSSPPGKKKLGNGIDHLPPFAPPLGELSLSLAHSRACLLGALAFLRSSTNATALAAALLNFPTISMGTRLPTVLFA